MRLPAPGAAPAPAPAQLPRAWVLSRGQGFGVSAWALAGRPGAVCLSPQEEEAVLRVGAGSHCYRQEGLRGASDLLRR